MKQLRSMVRDGLCLLLGATCAAGVAGAESAPAPDDSLTLHGITFYGTIDAGIQYDSASAPSNEFHPAGGTEGIISKNAAGSVTAVGGSYLSQSKLGLKGVEGLGNGWSGIFKVETFFNPWSGEISDAEKSMTQNNGRSAATQSTNADSSIAGQLFGGAAYLGVTHTAFGTLSFGRQNAIFADGIVKYDPMSSAQAFSPVGWSGTAAGAGDTEDRRLDSSAKYEVNVGGVHLAAMFQPKTGANPGTTQQFALGWVFSGGSIDAFYGQKNDAIGSSPLSAAQVVSLGQACAGTAVAGFSCAPISKALVGTVSDNTATALMAQYQLTARWKLSAAYEQLQYRNPTDPVLAGQSIIGGYVLVFVNPASKEFVNTRKLAISWIGARFSPTPRWDLIGSYYRYDQNSYATGANAGCSSTVSGACSGSENFLSFVTIYHAKKRFDVYGGAMWSQVLGGLASGFDFNTAEIDPTLGFRFNF
ncbi:MAG: porin [Steroidobacterales bacterium]